MHERKFDVKSGGNLYTFSILYFFLYFFWIISHYTFYLWGLFHSLLCSNLPPFLIFIPIVRSPKAVELVFLSILFRPYRQGTIKQVWKWENKKKIENCRLRENKYIYFLITAKAFSWYKYNTQNRIISTKAFTAFSPPTISFPFNHQPPIKHLPPPRHLKTLPMINFFFLCFFFFQHFTLPSGKCMIFYVLLGFCSLLLYFVENP